MLNKSRVQEFVVKNDCGCGSTIGPILSTQTGVMTVDVGMPQLSMHSIRETMGCRDVVNGVELFTTFYEKFDEVAEEINLFEA